MATENNADKFKYARRVQLTAWIFGAIAIALAIGLVRLEGIWREERVCKAFVVFTETLGEELDAPKERVERFKERLTEELRC